MLTRNTDDEEPTIKDYRIECGGSYPFTDDDIHVWPDWIALEEEMHDYALGQNRPKEGDHGPWNSDQYLCGWNDVLFLALKGAFEAEFNFEAGGLHISPKLWDALEKAVAGDHRTAEARRDRTTERKHRAYPTVINDHEFIVHFDNDDFDEAAEERAEDALQLPLAVD